MRIESWQAGRITGVTTALVHPTKTTKWLSKGMGSVGLAGYMVGGVSNIDVVQVVVQDESEDSGSMLGDVGNRNLGISPVGGSIAHDTGQC